MRLEARELVKSFGEKRVLEGVSFAVDGGKTLGILGRNGAGKTTSIRILMQVFPPDSGRVLLDGKPLDTGKVRIGYLPEERGLYPKKPIMDQLVYIGALHGMRAGEAKKSAMALLERLEMAEYANKKLDTLSKGNQQKIQLVATLISDPQIVILDEPFSGLDPVNAMLLKDIVREQIAAGKIVLFSSHQMNYIEEFCDDIVILNRGRIVLSGNIREIKHSYDRSRMLVYGPNLQTILDFSRNLSGELVASSEISGDHVGIRLRNPGLKERFVLELAQSKLDIDEFRVYEPTLNDIFVEYTEGAQ